MKKETLEEAAKVYAEPYGCPATNDNEYCKHDIISAFNNGAKWQQERMFELVEEYNQMLLDANVHEDHKEKSFKEWFEQFKKK
jgi:hypothetical protein